MSKCPQCGSPAYIGLTKIECENPACALRSPEAKVRGFGAGAGLAPSSMDVGTQLHAQMEKDLTQELEESEWEEDLEQSCYLCGNPEDTRAWGDYWVCEDAKSCQDAQMEDYHGNLDEEGVPEPEPALGPPFFLSVDQAHQLKSEYFRRYPACKKFFSYRVEDIEPSLRPSQRAELDRIRTDLESKLTEEFKGLALTPETLHRIKSKALHYLAGLDPNLFHSPKKGP